MKLLAYTIGGQIIGIDIQVWSSTLLSGNTAFMAIADTGSTPTNYVDITSFDNWDKFGGAAGLTSAQIKTELIKLIPNIPTPEQYLILENYANVGLNSMTNIGGNLTLSSTLTPNTLTGVTDTKLSTTGGIIAGDLMISGATSLDTLSIDSVLSDIAYGTPIPTALPSIAKTYGSTQIQVLGNNGPNLSNVTDFGVTWDLNTLNLPTLNLSTSDGIPAWYINLLPLATHTFGAENPSLTLLGTNITNFDGEYWANVISPGTFVLHSKTGDFTILFKDSSSAYIPPQYNSNFVVSDKSNNLFQSNIPAHLNGSQFNYATDDTLSTTTSTSYITKLTLTVNNLPTGLYRIGVGYTWNGSSTTYAFYSRVLLNSVILGDEHINRIANNTNYIPQQRTFYNVLAGNNTIELQYRTNNVAGTSRIRQTSIELWRVQ